ncbi:hypothetical protein RJ641_016910 [Dillenia turbinata]|uniref:Uncharacterized protein n=1 Tax=Dillenia turbinata TaxID=194707 RepID=A0AAN8UKF2_9MAGN
MTAPVLACSLALALPSTKMKKPAIQSIIESSRVVAMQVIAETLFPAVTWLVDAKGQGVSKFNIGDEECGKPKQLGTLVEFIVVEESLVAHKPKNISFEEAASLPLGVQTAIEGFITGGFKEGKSIFVVGGAGGDSRDAFVVAKDSAPTVDIT